jgi:hypothetical protein
MIRFEARTFFPALVGMLADRVAVGFWTIYCVIEQLIAAHKAPAIASLLGCFAGARSAVWLVLR